jgi:mono/diheme cytochrome c family protein
MKNIILASALGSALILTGCGGGDDAATTFVAQEFVSISGKISNLNDTGEPDIFVEGVYSSPGDPLNPTTSTDSNGDFSLDVLKGDAVFLRATKDSFATINSAKSPLNVNVSGLDIGMPTGAEAQSVIDAAFSSTTPPLVNHAWLVVDIEDENGEAVVGETITSSVLPADEVYTDCNGADSGATATTGPCPGGRPSPMYIAYFDAAVEANITVGSETQLAPIRMGEITYLEYETIAAPVGSIAAGQAKYDADCAICHAAGSYDTSTSNGASDLFGDSSKLIANISSYSPTKKAAVADLTNQEILDLTAFLDSL